MLSNSDDEEGGAEEINEEKELYILKYKIEAETKKLKIGKSQGEDEIMAEALKEMIDIRIEIMFKICNVMWNTGE